MKLFVRSILCASLAVAACCAAAAQTTSFVYQGSLKDGANAANGNYDFEFALFSAVSGGSQIGSTISSNSVVVANGTFAVTLDFGSNYPGASRFLEIHVRQTGGGAFTNLSPRQPITSAPYSVKSLNSDTSVTAANAFQLGGIAASQYVLTGDIRLSDARSPLPGSANYIQNQNGAPQASSNFNISGTGTGTVLNAATQFNIGGGRAFSIGGTRNTFVGINSGTASPNQFATDNSFFGINTGPVNTTGTGNSFFGSGAGQNNTSGGENSFLGTEAGQSNSTGGGNTFTGRSAGRSNSSGSNNSFFGATAGDANTTGSENSFFGRAAGGSNSTGNQNSMFGRNAGQLSSAGSGNSFFGFEAGKVTAAGGNSFFGASSGSENTTGFDNSFFGVNTGRGNTEGFQNSFFGRLAGRFTTTGDLNTFVGYGAGDNNIVGSNNTAIGANANVNDGLSFATAIGAGATVSTSDTVVIGRSGDLTKVRGDLNIAGEILSPFAPKFDNVSVAGDVHACVAPSNIPGYNYVGTCVSSIKYKENVDTFLSGVNIIRQLRPVSYRWKTTGNTAIGLIAEEVFKVEPRLTSRNEEGEIQSVKYDSVGVVLLSAVKEQQSQIDAQQKQIEKQQDLIRSEQLRNDRLQKQVDDLRAVVCSIKPDAEICSASAKEK